MPVTRIGPCCSRPGCKRPAQVESELCARCAHLARAFPKAMNELGEPLTELEVDLALSVSRLRFDSLVHEWLDAT